MTVWFGPGRKGNAWPVAKRDVWAKNDIQHRGAKKKNFDYEKQACGT